MAFPRELSEAEQERFRDWVRQNYEPFTPIPGWWHPVAQEEAREINRKCAKEWPFGR